MSDVAIVPACFSPAARCEGCGDEMDEAPVSLVEAFEVTGKWLCDDCAEEAFEAGDTP